nr:hypothetical protein [uncultured Flavobacterium sp.]
MDGKPRWIALAAGVFINIYIMSTFHSFISQPFFNRQDAEDLLSNIQLELDNGGSFDEEDKKSFRVISLRRLWVVTGIWRNLGGPPTVFICMNTDSYWATVSDEANFTRPI